MSLAHRPDGPTEVGLFVSARTLFAGEPTLLAELVPFVAMLDPHCRIGPVSLGFRPDMGRMATALGVCPPRVNDRRFGDEYVGAQTGGNPVRELAVISQRCASAVFSSLAAPCGSE